MAKTLNGADYRAMRRLSSKDNQTFAEVGETCERVPVESLPALVASGKIVPVASSPGPEPVATLKKAKG